MCQREGQRSHVTPLITWLDAYGCTTDLRIDVAQLISSSATGGPGVSTDLPEASGRHTLLIAKLPPFVCGMEPTCRR
jgi:hypothetical protein